MGNSQSGDFKSEDVNESDLLFTVGGVDDSKHALSTAWCYVIQSGKWLAIPPLLEPRKSCAAATMQNSLYVAGGSTAARIGIGAYGAGGVDTTSVAYEEQHALEASAKHATITTSSRKPFVLSSVRRYNAERGCWEHDIPDMQQGREEFGLEALDGYLFAVGGDGGCERHDLRTRAWEQIGDLDCSRNGCATAVLDGRLYCAGGWTGQTVHRSVEVYEPRMDCWTFTANMRERRRNFGLAPLVCPSTGSAFLVATGGQNEYTTWVKDPTATCEMYDVKANRWNYTVPLDTPKSYHATLSANNGTVYNLGGERPGWKIFVTSTVKDFDMLSNITTTTTTMSSSGNSSNNSSSNNKKNKWKSVSPALPVPVSSHGAASLCRQLPMNDATATTAFGNNSDAVASAEAE